jgi:hypothetical protein
LALFVALIVAIVVYQTCLDWRDSRRQSVFPSWASGLALAGLLGASFTAATSLASVFYEDAIGQRSSLGSTLFWPQFGFLLCGMGIVVLAVHKKRLRLLLLLTGLLTIAFWIGFALSS